ncbi:MAG: hypothetical protein V2A79_01070 [Planctomycetota bacterium]
MADEAKSTAEETKEATSGETKTEAAQAAAAQGQSQTQAATSPLTDAEIATLDARTQKYITELRQENAKDRTKAKETAAAEARKTLAQEIGKALGLVDNDDPAAAAKTAAEQRDAALAEAKAVKVEIAVMRTAAKHGASPEALVDSRAFMTKLAGLDPAADDFAAQVDAAVKEAVESNPTLKVAPPAPARSGGPVGGGTPPAGQLSREDLQKMAPADIVKAREEGRLKNLLGG